MVEIALGQKVRDRLTGFTGIVITVGYHYDGCIRVGVQPDAEDRNQAREAEPDEEFFYPSQLEVLQERTTWTERDVQTDYEYGLGDLVTDEVSKFSGVVSVVNTKLFNEPRYLAKEQVADSGGEPESEWIDESSVKLVDDNFTNPDTDFEAEVDESSTGAVEDSGNRDLKR